MPYKKDKKSEFLILFGVKSIEQIFLDEKVLTKWDIFVNVLVSIIFHVTVKYTFQGSYRAFSNCSLTLTHFWVDLFSFGFAEFFKPSSTFYSLVNPNILVQFFSVNIVKNARIVSMESSVFIPVASTVQSNRFWRISSYLHCYYV